MQQHEVSLDDRPIAEPVSLFKSVVDAKTPVLVLVDCDAALGLPDYVKGRNYIALNISDDGITVQEEGVTATLPFCCKWFNVFIPSHAILAWTTRLVDPNYEEDE